MHRRGWTASELASLTELQLQLPERCALRPLFRLTRLHTLKLSWILPGCSLDGAIDQAQVFPAAVYADLEQMSSLTQLSMGDTLSLEALQSLCAPPHALDGLQSIEFRGCVSAAHMESQIHLPLTTLNFDSMSLDAIASIPRFSGLRTLELTVDESVNTEPEASAFMMHLTKCELLTALTLHWCTITAEDLAQLCAALTTHICLRVEQYALEVHPSHESLRSSVSAVPGARVILSRRSLSVLSVLFVVSRRFSVFLSHPCCRSSFFLRSCPLQAVPAVASAARPPLRLLPPHRTVKWCAPLRLLMPCAS